MNDQGDQLDLAWKLLEDEGAERALEAAAGLDESNVETWVLRATAQIDLTQLDEAAASCARAETLGGHEHLGVQWARGEIALASWQIDEASRCYETILAQAQDEGAALERLALVRELQRRYEDADELLERDGRHWRRM